MPSKGLRCIVAFALLLVFVFSLRAARPAFATPEAAILRGHVVTWRGSTDNVWSNPANWDGDVLPTPNDTVQFAAGAPDALLDSHFGSVIGGIVVDEGYHGSVTLAHSLTVRGSVRVADGILTTPTGTLSVTTLDIESPGVVRMGVNGKLDVTGDGTPLTGSGLLDTTTNTPNSVEYTGRATTDLMAAGPAAAFHALADESQPTSKQAHGTPQNPGDSLPRAAYVFTRTAGLPLDSGENNLQSAVIDTANGFAYFGTSTNPNPGIVVKVRLSDFTRVGAVTLNSGEKLLLAAVIDTANGFAYFSTNTDPAIVVKIRLFDFTRVGALPLNTGENEVHSAVIDPAGAFAYFGTNTYPGIVVKVRLSDFTRVGALTFNTGENRLWAAAIDSANSLAYFGTDTDPGIVVKVRLSDFTRVGALPLNGGESYIVSAAVDAAHGFAYFGTTIAPLIAAKIVKVRLSDFSRVGALTLPSGENSPNSAVIDTAHGFAYFGLSTNFTYGEVIEVRLSDFTRAATVNTNDGENYLDSAVIDIVNSFAYFGTYSTPGIVVKVNLGFPPLDKRLFLPLIKR